MEPPARASPASAAAAPPPSPIEGKRENPQPDSLESAVANSHTEPTDDARQEDSVDASVTEAVDHLIPSPPDVIPPSVSYDTQCERTRQFAFAIASLRLYNPEFRLTPEVIEIMRVFFDDLNPDQHGTVSVHALFKEIERLDPTKEHVSEETRQLMRRDMHERVARDERVDFEAFCAWVMRWKETSPMSIQNMYTSWAKELTVLDFGLSEGDGVFVVPSDEVPRDDELRFQLSALLHRRRHTRGLQQLPPSKKLPVAEKTAEEAGKKTQATVRVDAFTDTEGHLTSSKEDRNEDEADQRILQRTDDHDDPLAKASPGVLSKHSMMTVSKSFVAGGLAGMVAKSALAPVDRIKLMFQVSDKRSFSFRSAYHLAKEIYVQDGFRALFRGNSLNIIRVVPYAGVQHSSFDFFRRQFHAYNIKHADQWKSSSSNHDVTKLSNLQLVTAGSLAGGLSLTLSYPLDLVRARFMVQHGKHNFKSIRQAVQEMYRVDGARSFSRGLLPSLMGTLPYTGIGFTLNERFKHWMLDLQQRRAVHPEDAPERLHPFAKLLCSYLAACIAQTATYPMDTIRRRIQTDGFVSGNGKTLRYTSITTTARIIVANEGWRGFFKGVTVNWMRSPLATGISLTAYDLLKEVLGVEQVAQ